MFVPISFRHILCSRPCRSIQYAILNERVLCRPRYQVRNNINELCVPCSNVLQTFEYAAARRFRILDTEIFSVYINLINTDTVVKLKVFFFEKVRIIKFIRLIVL